jgi:hypothetical protein
MDELDAGPGSQVSYLVIIEVCRCHDNSPQVSRTRQTPPCEPKPQSLDARIQGIQQFYNTHVASETVSK